MFWNEMSGNCGVWYLAPDMWDRIVLNILNKYHTKTPRNCKYIYVCHLNVSSKHLMIANTSNRNEGSHKSTVTDGDNALFAKICYFILGLGELTSQINDKLCKLAIQSIWILEKNKLGQLPLFIVNTFDVLYFFIL